LPRGFDLVLWCGRTLLLGMALYVVVGLTVSVMSAQGHGQPSPVGPIIIAVLALLAAGFLRVYWPPIRDWPRAAPGAGWCADPSRRHELRYWDGKQWTEHVADSGARSTDPAQ